MIIKIKALLEKKDTSFLILLLVMGLFLSFVEVIGIAAIMPFISMASNPEIILSNEYYLNAYTYFSFESTKLFIVYFGFFLILFYIFRAMYTMMYTYLLNKFTLNKYKSLVNVIFENYLNLPYEKFVKKNISEMQKIIITDAGQLSALTINTLTFLSEILVICILYILLLIVDVKMTIILTLLLGVKVFLLSKTISSRIKLKSSERAIVEEKYYKIISENLANFKLIKFISEKVKLLNNFNNLTEKFSYIHIYNNTIQLFPKIILEAFGFSLLMLAVIYVVLTSEDTTALISIISMYALALYRILPAITKILNSYNNIMYHSKSLDIVYTAVKDINIKEHNNPIEFNKNVELCNVSFSYQKNINIVDNISINIEKGSKVAFIGESGSGKSTLVDLICGIYKPTHGNILIDGIKLDNSNIAFWRQQIGYIPQSIYLFDGTVADNVVFHRTYDKDKLIKVLKQANIYCTIMEKEGLNTFVGEGGIQLSGGQKQRIGIARALYGDPEILVLDEATSALDSATEDAIMNEIYRISEDKTLMIIAHRLSTIKRCTHTINLSNNNYDK